MPEKNLKWAGKQVLIIEDDPDSADILTQYLELHGVEVTTVLSAREALAAVEKQPYYCVLSDLQMPNLNGWDFLALVRAHQNPEISRIPIIAVTALAMMGDRNRVLQAGFNGYVSKPINPDTFLDTIQDIISQSSP